MKYESFNTGSDSSEKSSKTEGSGEASDKKTTKKLSSGEASDNRGISAEAQEKKQKAERELARSIDRLSLFERPESPITEASKTPEAAEVEAPLESLSDEETQHITQEIAADHRKAIGEADELTAPQLESAAEFLDLVAEGQDTDEAFRTVAAEMGLSEEEIAEALAEDAPEGEFAPEDFDQVADDGEFDTSDDAEGVVPLGGRPTPPAGKPSVPPTGGGGSGGGSGGGGSPPVPPIPPFGGGATPPNPGMPPTPAVAPAAANTMPARANTYYQRRNNVGQLLLIGVVGYLIGRRRGRLRTERKLLPVQQKLEKQVTKLEQEITYKEQKLVALKAARQPEVRQAAAAPNPAERAQPSRQETRLNLKKPIGAERLGHMVIAAEAPAKVVEKTRFAQPNNIRQAFRAEEVKDMRRADLLELSEKIKIEGASLRHIYESRLIGEKQLRHLVSEYLQGKDIRTDLRREMVEHEIDFERDPILRDRVRTLMSTEGGSKGIGELLTKAGITNDDNADPQVKRRVEKAEQQAAQDAKRKQQKRVLADTAMATVITLLAAVVAILVLNR